QNPVGRGWTDVGLPRCDGIRAVILRLLLSRRPRGRTPLTPNQRARARRAGSLGPGSTSSHAQAIVSPHCTGGGEIHNSRSATFSPLDALVSKTTRLGRRT